MVEDAADEVFTFPEREGGGFKHTILIVPRVRRSWPLFLLNLESMSGLVLVDPVIVTVLAELNLLRPISNILSLVTTSLKQN